MNPVPLLHRREFLKTSTGVLTGLLAAGSPLSLLAPTRTWAVDLKTLTSAEGATLMAMARTIAPHDKLEDAAYALVIQGVDGEAAKDPALAKLLKEGVQGLGPDFARAGKGTCRSPEEDRTLRVLPDRARQDPTVALCLAARLCLLRVRGRGVFEGRISLSRLQRSALAAGRSGSGRRAGSLRYAHGNL